MIPVGRWRPAASYHSRRTMQWDATGLSECHPSRGAINHSFVLFGLAYNYTWIYVTEGCYSEPTAPRYVFEKDSAASQARISPSLPPSKPVATRCIISDASAFVMVRRAPPVWRGVAGLAGCCPPPHTAKLGLPRRWSPVNKLVDGRRYIYWEVCGEFTVVRRFWQPATVFECSVFQTARSYYLS